MLHHICQKEERKGHYKQRMGQTSFLSSHRLLAFTALYIATMTSYVLAFAKNAPTSRFLVRQHGKAALSAFSSGTYWRQNDFTSSSSTTTSPAAFKRGSIHNKMYTTVRRHGNTIRLYNSVYPLEENDGKKQQQQQQQKRLSTTSLGSTVTDIPEKTTSSDPTTTTTKTTTSNAKLLASSPLFTKPQPDTRHYRSILLPTNHLQVLLISDSSTDVESASIHVKAGHFNDPKNRAGLAHFHEHMLFLGTTKYPDENEYETFLGMNGGSSNAYTDMEDTNYYFSVNPLNHASDSDDDDDDVQEEENEEDVKQGKIVSKALKGALDRFSQFFISPKFESTMMERELRAINSEYINAITSDTWRNYALLKASCDVEHPFSKFGCGNYNTLTNGGDMTKSEEMEEEGGGGTIPKMELMEFWKKYYVGENMKLVVVGKANLDELEQVVVEYFSAVRGDAEDVSPFDEVIEEIKVERRKLLDAAATNGDSTESDDTDTVPTTAFGPSQLGIIREVIPVAEARTLKLLFGFPPLDEPSMKKSKPFRVLSHLLGHESPGSLHSLLNEEGWINGLSSGVTLDVSDFSMFSITVSLTPTGMKQRDQIISLIFQYISLIQHSLQLLSPTEESKEHTPILKEYHDEIRRINQINFQFSENGDPTSFASAMAKRLFKYEENPQDILIGPIQMEDLDMDITRQLLERLHPSNALITITNPDAASADKEVDFDDHDKDSASSSLYQDTDLSDAAWQKEKWYGAKYRQKKIDNHVMEKWTSNSSNDDATSEIDSRLKLPELNKFIATDFSLRCDDDVVVDDSVATTSTPPTNGDDTATIAKAEDATATITPTPPKLLLQDPPGLRLHHKMDTTYRVPKTFVKIHLTSPNVYKSPRSMTLNRLYEMVLSDDLTSFVYDARLAGCHYKVMCLPKGFSISLSGYSEKLTDLLDVLTSRMLSLAEEMLEGPEARPALYQKFQKAQHNLLRQTKNVRLDRPFSTAMYNSRMLVEDKLWTIQNYIDEMEEDVNNPLTMDECARAAEECLFGRVKVESLCMGNIDEQSAKEVGKVIEDHFLKLGCPLSEDEKPIFKSLIIPTKSEAKTIFGGSLVEDNSSSNIPIVIEELAFSEKEENNAVEVLLQVGSGLSLGREGVALLALIANMAYNSAFSQLRTKEQLGYLVSATTRTGSGGGYALSVGVQSSTTPPAELENRIEAWLITFRNELVEMSEERIAMETAAVVAQLRERDMKLADEVGSFWSEILLTETLSEKLKQPAYDRKERMAEFLTLRDDNSSDEPEDDKGEKGFTAAELKEKMLDFFDKHFSAGSPDRRAVSSRVYGQKGKEVFLDNIGKPGYLSNYDDIRHMKQFMSSWPTVPYWLVE